MKNKFNISIVFFLLFVVSRLGAQDQHPTPVADFTVTNLCYGSLTYLTNTSTSLQNPAYKWTIWQQGIPTPVYTTTAQNVNFQFPAKTTYTVQLNVTNYITPTHFHPDSVRRIIYIDSIPVADFDLKNCHSTFSNLSCCANNYFWDFGDGATSTLTNPVHTYTAWTNYTVTLIAGNGSLSDTLVRTISPYANTLTGKFTTTHDGDTVRFQSLDDSLKSFFCTWHWAFGDGSTYDIYGNAGWTAKHYYAKSELDSVYPVFLLVKDVCFSSYKQQNVFIKGIGRTISGTNVFPSPIVNDYLSIESNELDDLSEIRIIDCLGKPLRNIVPFEKPYGYYIWLGGIASGMYIVQLVFNDHIENHKIVKE